MVSFSSVQFSHSVVSNCLRSHEPQHARPPCPSPTSRVYPNSWPLSRGCHPTISSSVIPFSSCLQSFSASGSFQMSQLFASGGQSICHSINFHRTMFQLKKTKYILLFTFINFCLSINWYNFVLNSLAIFIKNSQKKNLFLWPCNFTPKDLENVLSLIRRDTFARAFYPELFILKKLQTTLMGQLWYIHIKWIRLWKWSLHSILIA